MKLRGSLVRSGVLLTRRFRSMPRNVHQMSLEIAPNTDALFSYTSKRWLWNEQKQMAARYRRFDLLGLQKVACNAIGADKCVSLEKLGEGNYNKAYRLTMGDGRTVIAKIPHPNAGPVKITTASEAATMEFVRDVLQIPVPKVLAWSASIHNKVGAEHIIMEEAEGSQLHEVWPDLELQEKADIVTNIVEIEAKLLSVRFDKIGSLYFRDSQISGCEPISGTIDNQQLPDAVRSRFCIGPIARREFWEKERSTMHRYQGPWSSSVDYLKAVVDREVDWIGSHAKPAKMCAHPWQYMSSDQQSPEAHIAALYKLRSTIAHIVPQDADISSARMWHPDFHAGNVFIASTGHITSIIDWQGAWATPLFIGANPPSLLDYSVDILMKLPDDFKSLDSASQEGLRDQVAQSILIHRYETTTSRNNPLMYKMMRHPHGQTLKQLEAFANATWDNCLYPLQEILVRIQQEWEYFATDSACPYCFEEDELQRHDDEADRFNQSREFWSSMRGTMTEEGYTLNRSYEKAVEALKDLRSKDLAALDGIERDKYDRSTWWVMELPTRA